MVGDLVDPVPEGLVREEREREVLHLLVREGFLGELDQVGLDTGPEDVARLDVQGGGALVDGPLE